MNSMHGGRGAAGSNRPETPAGYDLTQLSNFTPQMHQLFQSLFSHLQPGSYLSRLAGGDESIFEQIEKPAWANLQRGMGDLASRFSYGGGGPGAMSARHGSGFQLGSGQLVSDFASNLAANRQQLQMNALKELMGLSGNLLNQRPFENVLTPQQEEPDYWGQILGNFVGAIPGAIVGGLTGGPMGAVAGGVSGFGSSMSRPMPQFHNFYG